MRKFLTSLAAISLIGSLFLGAPAPVAAVDTTIDTVIIETNSDPDVRQVADALETAGRYQTYLVDDNTEVTTRIYFSGPDTDDGIFTTFSLSLVGSGYSFGADFGDTLDMTDFGDCNLDWTDVGPSTQTSTFREGSIDCDPSSSQDSVYIDFPISVGAAGPAVLSVDLAGSAFDFKVYFFADAPTADTIYVGPGSMTTNGAGSCTTPDFSTTDAAQGFEDQEAIDAALMSINSDDDTVMLCDVTYVYESDMREYDGDDLYSGTLHIEAENTGDAILDGEFDESPEYQLLDIVDASLDVDGLTFRNGASYEGGAIRVEDGGVNLNSTIFTGNEATGHHGGAIYVAGGNTEITYSEFTNNDADDNGGAIAVYGHLYIANSEFTDNDADDDGGAIYARYGDVTVVDSIFTGNTARFSDGGAILVRNEDDEVPVTTFSIEDSLFDDNTAEDYGGAVFSGHSVNLDIDSSTFTDNTANVEDGGAVYAKDDATVGFSVFLRNRASDDDAGAMYFQENGAINDSRFVDNFANDEGGAVFVENRAFIDDTVFLRNRSLDWAGALSLEGTASLDGAIFRANKSRRGGAIDSWGNRLYLVESRFINNRATRDGGAIIRDGETLFGDVGPDTIFRGNQARLGDAVAIYRWQQINDGPGRDVARTWARVWVAAGTTVWLVR